MIEGILPADVGSAEAFADVPDLPVFPAEAAEIAYATDKRRREFITVRHCARLALAEIGRAPTAILPGPNREPRWPTGIVGSMTHCDGYRAAVVAPDHHLDTIGIDAELHQPLPDGVLAAIAKAEEIHHLAELAREFPAIHWDTLAFSAKESIYKAWFPFTRRQLGFKDVSVAFEPTAGAFTAELHPPRPALGENLVTQLNGRWTVGTGLILTAVTHKAVPVELQPRNSE